MTVKEFINKVNNELGGEVITIKEYVGMLRSFTKPKFIGNAMFWFEETRKSDDGIKWLELKYKRMDSSSFDPIKLIEYEDGYAYIEDKYIPLMMQRYGFLARTIKEKSRTNVSVYNVILIKLWFAKHKPDYKVCGIDMSNACGTIILKTNTCERITHPGKFADFCISWMKEHTGHIEKTMKMRGVDYEAEIVAALSDTIEKLL